MPIRYDAQTKAPIDPPDEDATEDVITLDVTVARGQRTLDALGFAIESIEDVLKGVETEDTWDDFVLDHEALRHLYNQIAWVYQVEDWPAWGRTRDADA